MRRVDTTVSDFVGVNQNGDLTVATIPRFLARADEL